MDQGCTVIHLHLLLYILMRFNNYLCIPTICHYNNCYSNLKGAPNHDTHQTLLCV